MKKPEDMVLPYARRTKRRLSSNYMIIKSVWESSQLNRAEEYGNLGYLIRKCRLNLKENSDKTVKRQDWEQFYLQSGASRAEVIGDPIFQIEAQLYYGRTVEDLYQLAQKLVEEGSSTGTNINIEVALNFLYSEIVDAAFRQYVRLYRISIGLKEENKGYKFDLSEPNDYINNDIDLLIYKKEAIVGGVKLLFNGQTNESLSSLELQKHKTFEELNDVPMYYLKLDPEFEPISSLNL